MTELRDVLVVFRKEVIDALRDRRTLLMVLVSAVLLGPLVLVAISTLVASLEEHAEQREVYVAGIDDAPTLRNYLERQTCLVKPAPPDFEAQLRSGRLADPVIVIPRGFESALRHGDSPRLELVADSANRRAQAGVARVEQLLAGFNRERATLGLALRGVSVELLEPVRIERRELANTQTRATQLTGVLPFFVLMAVLYGALNAALDTTAGERERGSLEPLLMNPAGRTRAGGRQMGRGGLYRHADRAAQQLQLPVGAMAAAQRHAGRDVPVRRARGAAVPGRAVAVRRGVVGAADGGGDPQPQLQGGAGDHDAGRARGLAAAAGRLSSTSAAMRHGTCGCRRWRRTP